MVTTRSAAEKGQTASSSGEHVAVGDKHDIDEKPSPTKKRTKKQTTLEESVSGPQTLNSPSSKSKSKNKNASAHATTLQKEDEHEKEDGHGKEDGHEKEDEHEKEVENEKVKDEKEPEKETEKESQKESQKEAEKDTKKENSSSGGAVEPNARDAVPASILEKGIIYFFFRGRVGIDHPESVDHVRRTYIILRPIQKDAKLGDGTIGDAGNSRLIAIPKKVLPLSGKHRLISLVDKVNVSFQDLKDDFLASTDYVTKTAGTRHTPAATPIGEGVYAISTTGRESHLVYMMTLPAELGEVQDEIGLGKQGSFILSTRNPAYPPPANVGLPEGPDFTQEIKDEFRALRWIPSQPRHLNYVNSQILLIGESKGDLQDDDLQQELETLEAEDTKRMQGLKGDDSAAIFADLEVNANDYPKLQTTF